MAHTDLPTATSAVNTAHGKSSFVLVVNRRGTFSAALSIPTPVTDLNNAALTFTGTPVRIDNKHARVKLVAINAAKAVTPTDGVLSITIVDSGTNVDVADMPVDYINDPTA